MGIDGIWSSQPCGRKPPNMRLKLGSNFAMMEATLLLATVYQRFHVRLDPQHPVEPQPAITQRSRWGIRATVWRRSNANGA